MFININWWDFKSEFDKIRPEQFTYEGLGAIFDYFEEVEEETGEPIELDVIAICCDFAEYKSLEDMQQSYPDYKTEEDFSDQTLILPLDNGGYVIQQF